MTEETPLRPRAAYADAPAEPEFVAADLADVSELLRRAAEYADHQGDATIAAELRRGAAVLNAARATVDNHAEFEGAEVTNAE